jgi:hypothetical protein
MRTRRVRIRLKLGMIWLAKPGASISSVYTNQGRGSGRGRLPCWGKTASRSEQGKGGVEAAAQEEHWNPSTLPIPCGRALYVLERARGPDPDVPSLPGRYVAPTRPASRCRFWRLRFENSNFQKRHWIQFLKVQFWKLRTWTFKTLTKFFEMTRVHNFFKIQFYIWYVKCLDSLGFQAPNTCIHVCILTK